MAKKQINSAIVCDSNVFIDYLRNDNQTAAALLEIRSENRIMSVITAMELCKGAANKDQLKQIIGFIALHSTLQLNTKGVELALELIKKYHLSHNLSLADALIAASVIVADSKLFTLNVKDFDFISGLNIYYPPSLSNIKRR